MVIESTENITLVWLDLCLQIVSLFLPGFVLYPLFSVEIFLWSIYRSRCDMHVAMSLWLGISGYSGLFVSIMSLMIQCCCPGEKDSHGKGIYHVRLQKLTMLLFSALLIWGTVIMISTPKVGPEDILFLFWFSYMAMWCFFAVTILLWICYKCA